MTAKPSWARGTSPGLEENAQEAMRQDVAAGRQHLRGVGHLPLDPESARFELTEEQRANRGSRPRTRRWKALDKLDGEVDRLMQKQAEAMARVQDAEEALGRAPGEDARTLADWISGGERGERPAATLPERERERGAAGLLVEAVESLLDRKLEERLAHIERHRNKMLSDAQRAVDDAHQQLLAKVSELPALRQALLDARETMLWASHFPERVESYGFETAAALGLRKPIEATLGTAARVEYTSLLAALTADADALSGTFSDEQKRQLGHPDEATPVSTAMWHDDERAVAWRKAELARARQLGEFASDLSKLADDARDLRA